MINNENLLDNNSSMRQNTDTVNLLRWSAFVGNGANGGYHRSSQIFEILNTNHLHIIDLWENKTPQSVKKYVQNITYYISKFGTRDFRFMQGLKYASLAVEQWSNNKNAVDCKNNLLLWEMTRSAAMARFAHRKKFPIIALPHNIESFVLYRNTPLMHKQLLSRLSKEVESLKLASAVFCISSEEQWLLQSLNIQSRYLPYYPPKYVRTNLLNIRHNRLHSNQDETLLVLGSAVNPPTEEGMREIIKYLTLLKSKAVVCGSGTERLKNASNEYITIRGTVAEQELNHYMTTCRASVVHQRKGSGALTRIPELLMAGIPVIANTIAARSTSHLKGIFQYDTLEGFESILKLMLPVPPVPDKPIYAEEALCSQIRNLIIS